ncbi:MAG: MraY family glycosyltransferase [bacterium]
MNYYFFIFFCSALLSAILTIVVKFVALKFNIVDEPNTERKIHQEKMPLLGGVAVFLSFFIILFFAKEKLLVGNLESSHWIFFFVGACFLMVGGFLDDKYKLKPSQQIIWPVLASFAVVLGGVSIEKITNPFGGYIFLNSFGFYLFNLSGLVIVFWLMGMMYTTKLLDGIDGLVAGVVAIGGFVIFIFTMATKYYQPDVGLAALILAASCFGFLIFNWYPAKIFLGEGGSLFLGYALGTLAIISGGKIAIALLVMGIPIMDVFWTIARRIREGKNPFKFADRKHLHYRLLDFGLSQRKVVLIFYCLSLFFGLSALFLQSRGKVFALGILVLIMLSTVARFGRK